jgi:hypothetical protein
MRCLPASGAIITLGEDDEGTGRHGGFFNTTKILIYYLISARIIEENYEKEKVLSW